MISWPHYDLDRQGMNPVGHPLDKSERSRGPARLATAAGRHIMIRISTICAVSCALIALALSATAAAAFEIKDHPPAVSVHPTTPKVFTRSPSGPNSGSQQYLRFDFKNVAVHETTWTKGSSAPKETMSLNYQAVETQYHPQNTGGSGSGGKVRDPHQHGHS